MISAVGGEEDFSVGARNEERDQVHPHHSPRFDICEDCMPVAVDVLEAAALKVLAVGRRPRVTRPGII